MLQISPIPAFKDNYIWLLTKPGCEYAIVVDPGDASPVLQTLATKKLKLAAILLTHHHHDHIGGTAELLENYDIPVYGGINEKIALVSHAVQENQRFNIAKLDTEFRVIEIPGHTHGHVAYVTGNSVFCGDTLFTGGCGRLFEGTVEQLFTSLNKLKNLSDETLVYCGHEYTLSNLQFAQLVEPANTKLHDRIQETVREQAKNIPSVPSLISLEKQTNPFLRCHLPSVKKSVENQANQVFSSVLEIFRFLRYWKDNWILK